MKKILVQTLAASAMLFMIACGGEEKPKSTAPAGMMEVDLSSYGMAVTIIVPDSTKGIVEIASQPTGETYIKVGKQFQIAVIEDAGDIETEKNDIKIYTEVKQLKRYIVEEPTTLIYEQEVGAGGKTECHLYTIIKTSDNKMYVVKDIREDTFGEEAIKAMLESAKSIRPKGAAARV